MPCTMNSKWSTCSGSPSSMLNSSIPRFTVRGRIEPPDCCIEKRKRMIEFCLFLTIFYGTYRCLCPTIRRLWLQKVDHCAGSMEDDCFAAGQRNFTMPFARIRCISIFLFQMFGHFFIVRLETWIFSFVEPRTTSHFRLFALPVHRRPFACRNIYITTAAISDNNFRCCNQFNLIFLNKFSVKINKQI